jgi:predicted PurR-regulated permease PerM
MTQNEPSPRLVTPPPLGIQTVPGLLMTASIALLIWLLFREVGAFVLLATALGLLWPHRSAPWGQSTYRLLLFLGVLWILHKARAVVYPLLVGLLIAYWLAPLVDRLERRRVPRGVGAAIALLPTLAVGAGFAILVVPMLVSQLGQLLGSIPEVSLSLYNRFLPLIAAYLPDSWRSDAGRWLAPLGAHMETVLKGVWGGASGITRGVGAVLSFLAMAVLAPILTYYLLVDYRRGQEWITARIPRDRRQKWGGIAHALEQTLRSYFRGQALVALCVGVVLTTGFLIIQLPYGAVLGFLAGLLNLVPVIGFWTSTALCVLAAALSPEPWPMLLRLGIVLAVEQFLEGQVLTPRIVGRAVGLNPAVVLIAVLVFGTVLGPLGIIVAVPAVAMARTVMNRQAEAQDPRPPVTGGAERES